MLHTQLSGITQCDYQHECAKLLWDKYFKDLGIDLQIMTIVPPILEKRATTQDTLKSLFESERIQIFLQSNFKISILGYSNAPYVPYQADTAKAVLVENNFKNIHMKVVGDKILKAMPSIAFTDSIARRLYTFTTISPDKRKDFLAD